MSTPGWMRTGWGCLIHTTQAMGDPFTIAGEVKHLCVFGFICP